MAQLGLAAKAYYNTGGAGASTGWLLLSNVTDVTLNLQKSEADVTTRAANGWRQKRGTLKEGSVTFEMIWDPNDAGFTAVQTAFFANTSIGLEFFDQARTVSGAQGLRGDFDVLDFSRTEPLEEAIKVSVTVSLTDSVTAPEWVTVA